MLVPDRLRRATDVLTGNFTICPPVLAQRPAWRPSRRRVVRRARRPRAPVRRQPGTAARRPAAPGHHPARAADGAFYVYADVGHLTDDTMAFCHDVWPAPASRWLPGSTSTRSTRPRSSGSAFAGQGPVIEAALERLHSRRPLTFLPQRRSGDAARNRGRRRRHQASPSAPRARRGGRYRVQLSASARGSPGERRRRALRRHVEVRARAHRTPPRCTGTPPRPIERGTRTSTWPRPAAGAAEACSRS